MLVGLAAILATLPGLAPWTLALPGQPVEPLASLALRDEVTLLKSGGASVKATRRSRDDDGKERGND